MISLYACIACTAADDQDADPDWAPDAEDVEQEAEDAEAEHDMSLHEWESRPSCPPMCFVEEAALDSLLTRVVSVFESLGRVASLCDHTSLLCL